MKILIVKLKTKDKIEAYQIVSHLDFEHEVLEAEYDGKNYIFDKKKEFKKPNKFLRDDWDKK